MTTLITFRTSDGSGGRCDAKCYAAARADCHCICGGRNHAAGKEQALDNCREMAEQWIEEARASGREIEFTPQIRQQPLFAASECMTGSAGP